MFAIFPKTFSEEAQLRGLCAPTSTTEGLCSPTSTSDGLCSPTSQDYSLQLPPQKAHVLQKTKQLKGSDPFLRDSNLNQLQHTHAQRMMQTNDAPKEILRLEYLQRSSEFQNFLQRVPPRNPSERLSGVRFTVLNWAGATRLKGTTHLYLNLTSPSWSNSGSSPILPIPFRSNFQR